MCLFYSRGSPPSGLKATNVQLLKQAQTVAVQTPKANRNIILIRHGQHVRAVQEPTARRLTDKGEVETVRSGQPLSNCRGVFEGKQQVLETARHLKELQRLGFITSFSSIVSSGMIRAVESAELLFKELSQDASVMPWNLGSDNLLNEGSPCPPDPMPDWWTMEIQKGVSIGFIAALRRRFLILVSRFSAGQKVPYSKPLFAAISIVHRRNRSKILSTSLLVTETSSGISSVGPCSSLHKPGIECQSLTLALLGF